LKTQKKFRMQGKKSGTSKPKKKSSEIVSHVTHKHTRGDLKRDMGDDDATSVGHGRAQQFKSGHKKRFEGCGATVEVGPFGIVIATVFKDLGNVADKLYQSLVASLYNLGLNHLQVHGILDDMIIVGDILDIDWLTGRPGALVGLQLP
jgi:hypothetical protein